MLVSFKTKGWIMLAGAAGAVTTWLMMPLLCFAHGRP
jgi:hypothetical protein